MFMYTVASKLSILCFLLCERTNVLSRSNTSAIASYPVGAYFFFRTLTAEAAVLLMESVLDKTIFTSS